MKDLFQSLRRGLPRIVLLAGLGLANLLAAHAPELLGVRGAFWATLVPICLAAGKVFLGLAAGDLGLRILQPRVDAQLAAQQATEFVSPEVAPALVYLGRSVLAAVVLWLVVASVQAAQPPAAALPLLPVLQQEQRTWWPDHPLPSALGAQVEQETCPSLRHRFCWSPRAELRTARERGVGLGQLTVTARFDALAELKRAHPQQLAGLSWDDPWDARLQLRALVLRDLQDHRLVRGAATPDDHLAMALAAYNGGHGGLASDRRICAATPGCDPARWWRHVEHTSHKSRERWKGYGKSAFDTNREYPRNILLVRRERYLVLDAQ